MNVLILSHSYPDRKIQWRGIFVQEQAKALSLRYKIFLVYFKVDYTRFAPLSDYAFVKRENRNVTEYEVTVNRSFPVITQFKYLAETFRFVKKEIIRKNKIEIIHSHLAYPGGFLGAIIQNRTHIPNIVTEHSRLKNYFRSWVHKQCVRYALNNSAGIIAVSNALKSEIITFCPCPVEVVHNFVNIVNFKLTETKNNSTLNIGFLGGLNNTNKGLDLLLKSVSMLNDMNIVLHIGGDGTLSGDYKKLSEELNIRQRCIFYGEILREEISEFFSRLDIFVLSSRYETFGIVLIEAMACGVPVIATRCGGPQDIVTESTGILISKDSTEELSEAIKIMSAKLSFYNKTEIRRYAEEEFGQQTFIKRMAGIYQYILTNLNNE